MNKQSNERKLHEINTVVMPQPSRQVRGISKKDCFSGISTERDSRDSLRRKRTLLPRQADDFCPAMKVWLPKSIRFHLVPESVTSDFMRKSKVIREV